MKNTEKEKTPRSIGTAAAFVRYLRSPQLLQLLPDLKEGGILALLLQKQQPPGQQLTGLRMDEAVAVLRPAQMSLGVLEIVVGRGIGVFLLLIHPAGGDAVTEHLRHILDIYLKEYYRLIQNF